MTLTFVAVAYWTAGPPTNERRAIRARRKLAHTAFSLLSNSEGGLVSFFNPLIYPLIKLSTLYLLLFFPGVCVFGCVFNSWYL